jgi:hypothetical protein
MMRGITQELLSLAEKYLIKVYQRPPFLCTIWLPGFPDTYNLICLSAPIQGIGKLLRLFCTRRGLEQKG